VAVAGSADPEWGEAVTAVVVPVDASMPPRLTELRAHVRAVLPAHAAPRRMVLVEQVPRTNLGKVARGMVARVVDPAPLDRGSPDAT